MKNVPVITVKLNLDTTEFQEKLNKLIRGLDAAKDRVRDINKKMVSTTVINNVTYNGHKATTNTGYKLFTKDKFKEYMLSKMKDCNISEDYIKGLDKNWNNISKGFNFAIAVGQEDHLMFYSVMKFNNDVLERRCK